MLLTYTIMITYNWHITLVGMECAANIVEIKYVPYNHLRSDTFFRFLYIKKSKSLDFKNFKGLLGCLKSRSSEYMGFRTRHVFRRPWFFLFYTVSDLRSYTPSIELRTRNLLFNIFLFKSNLCLELAKLLVRSNLFGVFKR